MKLIKVISLKALDYLESLNVNVIRINSNYKRTKSLYYGNYLKIKYE